MYIKDWITCYRIAKLFYSKINIFWSNVKMLMRLKTQRISIWSNHNTRLSYDIKCTVMLKKDSCCQKVTICGTLFIVNFEELSDIVKNNRFSVMFIGLVMLESVNICGYKHVCPCKNLRYTVLSSIDCWLLTMFVHEGQSL